MRKTVMSAAFVAGAAMVGAGPASAQAPGPRPEPAPPGPTASAPAPEPTHTVASGEYLWKISQDTLGSGERWIELFAFNRDRIQNPNVIEAGQVLKIPTAPVPIPGDLLTGPAASSTSASSSSRTGSTSWRSAARTSRSGRSGGGRGGGGGGDHLASIRACESGGNYGYDDGTYSGAYNFDQQTWESVGGSGRAADASAAEQDARASRLISQRGSSPWPNCG